MEPTTLDISLSELIRILRRSHPKELAEDELLIIIRDDAGDVLAEIPYAIDYV